MTTIQPSAVASPVAWAPSAPRPTAAAGINLTLGDLLRVLRERQYMVLGIWLFFAAVTVTATAVVQQYYPLFRSDAYVQVTSLQAQDPNDPLGTKSYSNEAGIERLLLDQSYLAISPNVVMATLQDPDVRQTQWFREAEDEFKRDNRKTLDDAIKDTIAVNPVRRSSLLQVTAEVKVPIDAPVLVNTLIEKYIELADKISKDTYRNEQNSLEVRLTAAKAQRDSAQSKINDHLSKYPYVAYMLGGNRTPADDDVMYYNSLKNDFATQALNYKNQWDLLENFGPQGLPVTDEIRAAVQDSPLIEEHRRRLSAMEEGRTQLLGRLGANHRDVREYEKQINEVRRRLEQLQIEAETRLLLQQRDEARRAYATAQQTLVRLEELYAEAVAKQTDQQEKLKQYREMTQEMEGMTEKLDELNKNAEQLSAVINRAKTVQIVSISPAIEPKIRSRPNWMVWVPAGLGLGLMASIGLALLLEFSDASVRTPRDLIRQTELPMLGVIPTVDDDEVEIERIETAAIDAPHSVIAEAFRQMRTNLFFASPPEQQGVILVTSPGPEEGKTTVAVNLAASIAVSGRRVLLIDANFRRPALRTFFPEAAGDGLSNALIGQATAPDLIRATRLAGLDVLSTGPIPPNPAELLGSRYLDDLIADARTRYDKVIIDAPPVLLVSDATVLAGAVDSVVLVCRFRQTLRGALQRARNQLESINALILGAALNAVQTTRSGYFRKQYRAFYDYQPETDEPRSAALPAKTAQRELDADEPTTPSDQA